MYVYFILFTISNVYIYIYTSEQFVYSEQCTSKVQIKLTDPRHLTEQQYKTKRKKKKKKNSKITSKKAILKIY